MANLSSHGVLLVAAGSILWGFSGIARQYILQGQGISPEWLTFFRLFVAGSLLLLISHLMGKDIVSVWKSSAEKLRLIIFGCLGMLGTQYCYFACIKVSNAAAATVLEYIMPVLIIMWYCMREKRLPRGKEVFCAVFAIVGTVLIATAGDLTSLALPPEALFWGLLSAFACALYTISPVGLILKYSAPVVVGWGMFLGSLVLMPVTLMTTFTGVVDTNTLLAFAYVVVFGTILSFVFYLGGVAYVSPSRGSIISALEPVSSVIFSFLLFSMTFGMYELTGMALIIIATVVAGIK